jgi:ribosomal protein S18 acetylase RimI-like enzyme
MEKGITAKAYLLRDRLHHIDMLEALRRGNAEVVYESPDGVLLFNSDISCWLISAMTPEESRKMLAIPEKLDFACVHQDFTVSQLKEKYDVTFFLDCVQAAYLKKEPVPVSVSGVCEFRRMPPEDVEWVNTNYRNNPDELGYVRFLLEKGLITGAYVDGKRAGFIGRHSEGSVGLLEVLPEYRRLGIGEALSRDAFNRELKLGNIPYGQVVWDNEPSLALQRKIGSEISEGHVYWMDLAARI